MMIVNGVLFGEDSMQVMYMEQQFQSERGSLENTLVVQLDAKGIQLMREMQEALEEVVDGYMVALRNPPDTLDRRNRFTVDDDDDQD